MAGKQKTVLLMNERAAADAELAEAIEQSRSRGTELKLLTLNGEGDAFRKARNAARSGARAVVACGGDGTLNEVVNGVIAAGNSCAVGVIPFGTANDFATAAGIGELPRAEQLQLILDSTPTNIDVGRLGEECFINCASVGFGAEVTAETPRLLKALFGGFAYSLTGAVMAMVHEEKVAHVQGGDINDWEDSLLFLTVANGKLAGGGYTVAGDATVVDGMLDVFLMPEPAAEDLLDVMGAVTESLLSGERFESSTSVHARVTELSVISDLPLAVNLDGEARVMDELDFGVLPARLPFFLPETSPLLGRDGGA